MLFACHQGDWVMKREIPEIRMPFGRYKGMVIHEICSGYLKWVSENIKDDRIASAADEEWQYREKYNCHIEE